MRLIKLFLRALEKATGRRWKRLNDLGVIYMQQSRTADALHSLQAAAKLEYPIAFHNLGMLQQKAGNTEAAVRAYQRSLELQPNLASAARRMAWILVTTEDEEVRDASRADELIRQHYDLETTRSTTALDTGAAIKAAQGEFDLALAMVTRAITLAESSPKTNQAYIGELRRRMERYRKQQPWIGGTQP